MKIPLSWINDYVETPSSLEELAKVITMAGLEVDGIQLVGLPFPEGSRHEFKYSGISWDRTKIVVAEISEVMPHPNADRLTLCKLFDGIQEHIVLTGAPNLFQYKGIGPLNPTLKVAYAKEGAQIYDGHQPGLELTTLKRAKIRGIDSYSMVCSEKELGISDEHEGIILLPADAVAGTALVDYMGDAILEISILPNMIRNACVLGVAREIAAMMNIPLRKPSGTVKCDGADITGQVSIEITNPELNPRFVVGLIREVTLGPSPFKVQMRLKMAGMRPINNIVDATNYLMLELGEPLHAFDFDALVKRAGGTAPKIITRQAQPGEKLTTLDGIERNLDSFTELVCDTTGSLSIAGVMGGQESEVNDTTRNVLLEGASWNFINIRKTAASQKLASEAGYRFSRGIHPALAEAGVTRGLELMRQWSGGEVSKGLVDAYPVPQKAVEVAITTKDVRRTLGIDLSLDEINHILTRLEFECAISGDVLKAIAPAHRLDIGEGLAGKADVMEEIARIYGYARIPETRLSDTMPAQVENVLQDNEEKVRDVLVSMGMQEVITYRLTTPEREAKTISDPMAWNPEYIRLQNPITPDRVVMRRSLLSSVLEIVEKNVRLNESLGMFEVGAEYLVREGQQLPEERSTLAIVLTGKRQPSTWDARPTEVMNFFDMKGIVEDLIAAFKLDGTVLERTDHPSFHPGKCARLVKDGQTLGTFGELHPQVKAHYEFLDAPIIAAMFDLEGVFQYARKYSDLVPVPTFPPILEDLAVVVDEAVTAGEVEEVIRTAGGNLLTEIRLFDIFRGPQLGEGKKSLAYSLTYQAADRTLTDQDAKQIRNKIIKKLDLQLSAKLRA